MSNDMARMARAAKPHKWRGRLEQRAAASTPSYKVRAGPATTTATASAGALDAAAVSEVAAAQRFPATCC